MKIEFTLPTEKALSEAERKGYCASISAIFPILEKDIKEKMGEELVKTYTEADDFNKVLRGQGILEGMAMLLEHWRLANLEHQEPKVDE
jgi:hypothetical protein